MLRSLFVPLLRSPRSIHLYRWRRCTTTNPTPFSSLVDSPIITTTRSASRDPPECPQSTIPTPSLESLATHRARTAATTTRPSRSHQLTSLTHPPPLRHSPPLLVPWTSSVNNPNHHQNPHLRSSCSSFSTMATSSSSSSAQLPNIEFTRMFINGEWVDGAHGASLDVIFPHDGSVVAKVQCGGAADVEKAVAAAARAFANEATTVAAGGWASTTGAERASLLRAIATELRARAERIARYLYTPRSLAPIPNATVISRRIEIRSTSCIVH